MTNGWDESAAARISDMGEMGDYARSFVLDHAMMAVGLGWIVDEGGARLYFAFDHYLQERSEWVAWRDMRIQNWHRPLSAYMRALLGAGLVLRHFDEPAAHGGDPEAAENHSRVPWFLVMEWEKPDDPTPRQRRANE